VVLKKWFLSGVAFADAVGADLVWRSILYIVDIQMASLWYVIAHVALNAPGVQMIYHMLCKRAV
jgi:hypothetical protein